MNLQQENNICLTVCEHWCHSSSIHMLPPVFHMKHFFNMNKKGILLSFIHVLQYSFKGLEIVFRYLFISKSTNVTKLKSLNLRYDFIYINNQIVNEMWKKSPCLHSSRPMFKPLITTCLQALLQMFLVANNGTTTQTIPLPHYNNRGP